MVSWLVLSQSIQLKYIAKIAYKKGVLQPIETVTL